MFSIRLTKRDENCNDRSAGDKALGWRADHDQYCNVVLKIGNDQITGTSHPLVFYFEILHAGFESMLLGREGSLQIDSSPVAWVRYSDNSFIFSYLKGSSRISVPVLIDEFLSELKKVRDTIAHMRNERQDEELKHQLSLTNSIFDSSVISSLI